MIEIGKCSKCLYPVYQGEFAGKEVTIRTCDHETKPGDAVENYHFANVETLRSQMKAK